MRNILLVAWREFAENAKTKGFWIGLFMLPLILFLSAQIPILLEKKGKPLRHFILIDQSGEFKNLVLEDLDSAYYGQVATALREYATDQSAPEHRAHVVTNLLPALSPETARTNLSGFLEDLRPWLGDEAPGFVPPRRVFNMVEWPHEGSQDEAAAALRPYLRGEKMLEVDGNPTRLDAAIFIPKNLFSTNRSDSSNPPQVQYWSANLADKSLGSLIQNTLNNELRRREYLARGLDVTTFREIEQKRVGWLELNPKKEAGQEAASKADTFAQWAPVAFVYLLWVAIFSISQMLLNNTIEEKSNRVIEVLLSSVTPAEYVIGKLAGIAAVGVSMISAWIGAFTLMLYWKSRGPGGGGEFFGNVLDVLRSGNLLAAFMVYFILGYLLYATIILAIGSVCNTLKEAQNYMGVITLLMIVPMLTMTFIPKDPNGAIARFLSWIPIYTPFVMMNRAAAHPPAIDLWGTMILLLAAVAVCLAGAIKIFRIGVLRTGQPPRVVEMLRWMLLGKSPAAKKSAG